MNLEWQSKFKNSCFTEDIRMWSWERWYWFGSGTTLLSLGWFFVVIYFAVLECKEQSTQGNCDLNKGDAKLHANGFCHMSDNTENPI